METKYYRCGLRPVIQEIEEEFDTFYAFQWNTGEFKEDMEYNHEINFDPSGEVEEINKKEFDAYVEKIRKEKGFA